MSAAPDTWMAFYVGDYVKNTLQLTTRQHGAYLLLILACWQHGGAVDGDDETLATITKLSLEDWRRDRPKLAPYFEVTPLRWTHRRVLHELAEAEENSKRRSRAGMVAAAKRWDSTRNASRTPDAMPDGMRNDAPSPSPSPSQSPSESPSPAPSPTSSPGSADARAPRAQLIPEDWQPASADLAALRQERPDVVGEVYERRLRDFRDWCRAKAVTSHDITSTWRSFMRRTDAPRQAPAWKAGQPAAEHRPTIRMGGPDGLWKMRLSGYRPGDPWKYEGDPPGGPNCRVPAELIPHWRAWLRDTEAAS